MGITRNKIINGSVDITKVSRASFMQAGQVTADASGGGTVVAFPVAFDSIPKIVAADAGSAAGAIQITTQSAGSFTLVTAAAGTVDWIAVISPTG